MNHIDAITDAHAREFARAVAAILAGEQLPQHGCEAFDALATNAAGLVVGESELAFAQVGAAVCHIVVDLLSSQLQAERLLLLQRVQR